MTGNGQDGHAEDPLLGAFVALRDALAPFGVEVPGGLLRLWRDMAGHGVGPFTGSGEFDPAAVARLEAAVALMRQSAADAPTGHPSE